jgi:hypothetical protein
MKRFILKMNHLDRIQIKTPCFKNWDDMEGSAHRRYCGGCQKHVYDLSSLSRIEAEVLLRFKKCDLCVRYQRNEAGEMRNVSVRRRMRAWSVALCRKNRFVPTSLLAVVVALFAVGCNEKPASAVTQTPAETSAGKPREAPPMGEMKMGDYAPAPLLGTPTPPETGKPQT